MRNKILLNPAGLETIYDSDQFGIEPMVNVEESEGAIELSLKFPAMYLSDDSHEVNGKRYAFKQVDIDGVGYLVQGGKPLLPSFQRYVQIPDNCTYELKVNTCEPIEFEDIEVLPAQDHISDGVNDAYDFEFDEQFYKETKKYPAELVEITGPYELDAYRAIVVHIRPAQYLPKKKKLRVYANIVVTVILSPSATDVSGVDMYDRELELESFGNLFVNPRRNIEERTGIPKPIRPVPSDPLTGSSYLIIANDDFLPAAQKLADWKILKGLSTKVVPISSIGNSVEAIKKYVRKERLISRARLRYLLLFGDVNHIATETIAGGPWGANASDYYYTTKADSSGGSLVMPALSGGRIPAQSLSEAMEVVNKIIQYEKNPPADPEYYRRMTFAAFFQDDAPQDGRADRRYMKTLETIREHLLSLGFDIERVYVSNNPNPQWYRDGSSVPLEVKNNLLEGTEATDTLISATNEGQLIMSHRDHGLEVGWHMPHFQTGDLGGVITSIPTIFYSVNCLTGKFDLSALTDSFAEALLQMPGGAPSLIAATRVSHSFLNDDLTKALFDGMWPGVLPTFPGSTAAYGVKNNRLGDLLNYAKSYLPIVGSGSTPYIKDHYEIYHVVGDPTLELWKDVPMLIRLRAFIRNHLLFIHFERLPKGCLVTLWHKDTLLKKLRPSSTVIKLSLRDLRLRPILRPDRIIRVCVAAPGCRYRELRVRI